MSKIVILGYYGHENFGDDIMLYNIVEYLHGENDLHIITSDINKTKIPNVKRVNLYETYKSQKIQNFKLFFRSFYGKDFLIWGGGTCFSDEDGVVNPVILLLAKILRLKIVFIGVGSNEIMKYRNKLKMRLNSLLIDKVYVRDQKSKNALLKFFKKNKLSVTEDLVYLSDFDKESQKQTNTLTISLRNLDNYISETQQELMISNIVRLAEYITQSILIERINVLVLDNEIDYDINNRVYVMLHKNANIYSQIYFENEGDFMYKQDIIRKTDIMICLRLHGIFMSEMYNIKTIGIGYSQKVETFMKKIGSGGYINIDEAIYNPDLLCEKFDELEARNENKTNIKMHVQAACENFTFIDNLDGGS